MGPVSMPILVRGGGSALLADLHQRTFVVIADLELHTQEAAAGPFPDVAHQLVYAADADPFGEPIDGDDALRSGAP